MVHEPYCLALQIALEDVRATPENFTSPGHKEPTLSVIEDHADTVADKYPNTCDCGDED